MIINNPGVNTAKKEEKKKEKKIKWNKMIDVEQEFLIWSWRAFYRNLMLV